MAWAEQAPRLVDIPSDNSGEGMATLTVVSLFTGTGGLDYGFEAAGFETRAAVEMDADCIATLRANRHWEVIGDDIHAVSSGRILDAAGLRRGQPDVLIGGPPCQPFSKSGYWANGDTKRLSDPRASTLEEYMRCVRDLLPRVFLLENVHGISYSGKEEGFRLLERWTQRINRECGTSYAISWRVVNAADYGVPQLRRRFLLVGDREGRSFSFPEPTHAERASNAPSSARFLSSSTSPHVTAWDAIGHLDDSAPADDLRVRGQWADLLPSIPEGENYLWHTNRKGGLPLFGWRTRYWSFLLKLAKNRPAWTIQAQPGPAIGPFHWRSRLLSVEELAALQTFPPGVKFVGGRHSVQRQLGNAVPSLLAEVMAGAVSEQLFGKRLVSGPTLAVPVRRPIPPAEPVRAVPTRFQQLVGDHDDHPGTGRGRSARRRLTSEPMILV
jgi:DNA (cytosine-5)-methyltransferase 1